MLENSKKAIKKLYQSYRDECALILREGISKETFIKMDVPYMSILIVSIVQGAIIQYIIEPQSFDYKKFAERIREQILQMIIRS